jgi:hypothetical protein
LIGVFSVGFIPHHPAKSTSILVVNFYGIHPVFVFVLNGQHVVDIVSVFKDAGLDPVPDVASNPGANSQFFDPLLDVLA